MNVIREGNAVPIFSWCPNIEEGAMNQMKAIAQLPYVKYCALMPDAHAGMMMPIGGVVACDNVVVPNFVGVDIGCGMCAIKTSLHKSDFEDKEKCKKVLHSFSRGIPVGFAHNNDNRVKEIGNKYGRDDRMIDILGRKYGDSTTVNPVGDLTKSVYSQIGTLGGGNHFCEVQYDEENCVWIMIHSGSRNIGKLIGDYFNELAIKMNTLWYSNGSNIPFLPVSSPEGENYLYWMNLALKFAYMNRKIMMDEVVRNMSYEFPGFQVITDKVVKDTVDNMVNIHHNFAQLENHFGKNYWIHRKGATMARKGITGIIPGSMGTCSYIVKGLGEEKSMMSCSHGAGRKMGRMEFCRQMKDKYAQIEEELKDVVHSEFGDLDRGKNKGLKDVSESPGAYKDIDEVIKNEIDLIQPIVKLRPLICLKG